MGLIQKCPDDEHIEEPSLATLETVGNARRRNYLSKALARARAREEAQAGRPSSAAPSTASPSTSLNPNLKAARCISASVTTPATRSSPQAEPSSSNSDAPWSSPWMTQAAAAVAAHTTRPKEVNLSDTLANTMTTDMSILRRRPSSALPNPTKSRLQGRASPPSTAAAVAAAALSAATMPRRSMSASSIHQAAKWYPDLSASHHTINDSTDYEGAVSPRSPWSGVAASTVPTAAVPPRPGPQASHRPHSIPPRSPARPTSTPHHSHATPAHPLASLSKPTVHPQSASCHPRPDSGLMNSPARPASAALPSRSPAAAAASLHHPHRAEPSVLSTIYSSRQPNSRGAHTKRCGEKGDPGHHGGALKRAALPARSSAQSPARNRPHSALSSSLPQWSVNERPFDDMLQFQGTDRNDFDTVARGQSSAVGASGEDTLKPRSKEEDDLPVGAQSTAIFMAQTTGSMDGLKGLKIMRLPTQVFQYLQNEGKLLRGSLDLSHNLLVSLPFLHCTPSISSLLLSHNGMVSLPGPVFHPLTCLQALDLSHNKLEELPSSLGGLHSLKHLNASHNCLEVLPTSISELTGLVTLLLNHNRLFCLPQSISCLTSLERLAATDNRMTGLPPDLGSCTRLSMVELQHNNLTALPNSLKGLHTWLMELHLDDNGFTVLPREVALLTKLNTLSLSGNPLLFPPRSVAAGGAEAVRSYLAMFSTPGTSQEAGNGLRGPVSSHDSSSQGVSVEGGVVERLDQHPELVRGATGYQAHERTDLDVKASTYASCQVYNPENQGSLLLHMQFEAEERERQMVAMRLKLADSEKRAELAERDAAELAETLRHTLNGGQAARSGTVYEQSSAELARAVRILESDLREANGELCMAQQQLQEARKTEAEQCERAELAARDTGFGAGSIQCAAAMEAELHAMRIREAKMKERILRQLNEFKQMEDRCLKAEAQLDSTMFGEHGAAKIELQGLREYVLVSKLQQSSAAEAAQAREAALHAHIASLEASLEATRLTMRDMCDSTAAATFVQNKVQQAARYKDANIAGSWEQEASRQQKAVLDKILADQE